MTHLGGAIGARESSWFGCRGHHFHITGMLNQRQLANWKAARARSTFVLAYHSRNLKRIGIMRTPFLALFLLAQGCLSAPSGAAQQTDACRAEGSAVIKAIETANHCQTATDCTVLLRSCGTAVNRKDAAMVETIQKKFFSSCGEPQFRCKHWTQLVCEQGKCLAR